MTAPYAPNKYTINNYKNPLYKGIKDTFDAIFLVDIVFNITNIFMPCISIYYAVTSTLHTTA